MATHLPLPVVILAQKIANLNVLNIKNEVLITGIELFIVLIIEVILIIIINKFFKFLIIFPKKDKGRK